MSIELKIGKTYTTREEKMQITIRSGRMLLRGRVVYSGVDQRGRVFNNAFYADGTCRGVDARLDLVREV